MTGIVCCITQTRPSSVTCSDLPRITIRPNENQTRASSMRPDKQPVTNSIRSRGYTIKQAKSCKQTDKRKRRALIGGHLGIPYITTLHAIYQKAFTYSMETHISQNIAIVATRHTVLLLLGVKQCMKPVFNSLKLGHRNAFPGLDFLRNGQFLIYKAFMQCL